MTAISKNIWHIARWPLIAALVVAAAGFGGVSEYLGAHPWWSAKTAYTGAGVGFVVGVFLRALWAYGVWLPLVGFGAALVSAGIAHYGKTKFAASYADDAFAGQLWHFGWIGAAFFMTLAIGTLVRGKS